MVLHRPEMQAAPVATGQDGAPVVESRCETLILYGMNHWYIMISGNHYYLY